MRFSLRREQQPPPPPPPPSMEATGEEGVEGGFMSDEESSYGPMPPPPPPPPSSLDEVVALRQAEYDEENDAMLFEKEGTAAKGDPPSHQPQNDTTQDITQDNDEDEPVDDDDDEEDEEDEPVDDKEEEHVLRDLPKDNYDDEEGETEIPDDDDAQSVEIPPTSVVQRMIAEESFNHEKQAASSTLFRAGTVMTCCLVVLAIVLGVGIGTGAFTQDSGNNNNDNNSNNNSTDRGSGSDNGSTDSQRVADIQLYLSSISVVPDNIQGTDTAESKAVSWLIAEDPLSLGAETTTDQFRLSQRYALLAFYFGSSREWINETGWLVFDDECEWFGVTCQEGGTGNNTANAVTALVLPSNAVNTQIPPDFVLLTSLTTLDVSDNIMEQDLSTYSWASMTNMRELRLDGNNFTGDISTFMALPVNTLEVLSIGTNGFTGTIPDELSAFRALTEINIERNQLSGPISDVVSDLNITTLRIGENNFDPASFPVFIYTMTQLEVLGLGAVNINSEIEGALMNLVSLRVLEVYGNPMNGTTIPNVVLSMTNLEEMIAFDCQFTGPFPDLSGWTNMKILQLHDNIFTGTIPDTLNALSNLQILSLEGNMLTGSLPATITSLQKLEILDLSKNPLSFVIPIDIGGLFSLRELRLNAMNHPDFVSAGLIGTIPTSIGNLARLEVLELRRNYLDGALPDTIGGLDALQIFDVQFNALSGPIPNVVGDWNDTIRYIELSNNTFTGSIPTSICGTQIETFVADCDLACTCCTDCV